MDVDWRVKRDTRLAPACDLLGMTLGIGGCEFAAGVPRAGNETGADGIGGYRKTKRFDPLLRCFEFFGWHSRDEQILPDGEAKVAIAELACDIGEAAHLNEGESTDRNDNADPVQSLDRKSTRLNSSHV